MLHEQLSNKIIASAIAVHRAAGPGLAEHSYHAAMAIEMTDRGMRFQSKPVLMVTYKGATIGCHIPDFIVEGLIVVELKAYRTCFRCPGIDLLACNETGGGAGHQLQCGGIEIWREACRKRNSLRLRASAAHE